MAINFPNSPSNGDTHTASGKTFTYDATAGLWNPADSIVIPSSDTAPSSPSPGDVWFDSSSGTLYFYYNDGSSSQWVGVSGADGAAGADGADGADGATGATGPAGTATHQDTWRLSSDVTADTSPITTWTNTFTNTNFQATLGSGMTHSSGYFTFPTTGYWRVEFFGRVLTPTSDNFNIGIGGALYSSGTLQSFTGLALQTVGDVGYIHNLVVATHVNITNTADLKVGFYANSIASGNRLQASGSSRDDSYVMFTRLADAV